MKGAINEYQVIIERGQTPNVRFTARAWNVPRTTLQRRINGKVGGFGDTSGRRPEESEKELASLTKALSKRSFPLTK